jgi:hypothetical protein
MPHILLLGAGFSRNWGGWLAREIGDALLQRVAGDQYLRDILNRSPAFEDALSILQGEAASSAQGKDRLAKFEDAISYVFDQMNRSYAGLGNLDFGSRHGYSIQAFLARFDAIFTLNQDLLLELSYQIPAGIDWNGYQFPGMVQPEPSAKEWRPSGEFRVRGDAQPIFKLHGSVNWRAQDGSSLLFMGANKTASIRERELFIWYMDAFKFHIRARYPANGDRL